MPHSCTRHPVLVRIVLLALAMVSSALSAAPPVNTLGEPRSFFRSPEPTGIAIRGYDPVAYHTLGAPTPGSAEHAFEYQGATWHFANAQHRQMFVADPETYVPAYGGYCAYGVARGYLVKIEPDQWEIVDGRLYLNYDEKVSHKWRKDIPGFIRQADAQFADLITP